MHIALTTSGGGHGIETGGPHLNQAPTAAVALLRRALETAELLTAEALEPTAADDPTADHQAHEVAEVAMLVYLASDVEDPEIVERAERVANRLAPLTRSAELRRRLAFRPAASAPLALAHACLHRVGLPDDRFDAAVRGAFAGTAARAGDRTACRILEVAWIRHLVLGDHELVNHPILPLTCLGQGLDLIDPTVEESYAFSRTLRYATDFGRLEPPAWVDRETQSQTADVLVAKALADDDVDLLWELLMVPTLLQQPWSRVQEFGWLVLTAVWARHPILPGLAGGLMLALTLRAGGVPSVATPQGFEPIPGEPAWQTVWRQLDITGRERYAVVDSVVSLHRVVADKDLSEVLRLLGDPCTRELPPVLVQQSVELLMRVAALD